MTFDAHLDIPEFARIEIMLSDSPERRLPEIAAELRTLAGALDRIAATYAGDTAMLLAYRHIRAASKELRAPFPTP